MRLRWLPPILIWLLASGRIISLSDNRETILPPQYASHTKEENYHHFTKKEVRVWTMITSLNFCPTQSWVKNQPWFIGLMSAVSLWKHFFLPSVDWTVYSLKWRPSSFLISLWALVLCFLKAELSLYSFPHSEHLLFSQRCSDLRCTCLLALE